MNKYLKEFLKRGLMFSGLGPVVAGIVYVCIENSGVDLALTGGEVLMAVISTYIMAFVHAGSGVFHQIEKWSRAKAMLCQMSSIYVVYMAGYLINSWFPLDWRIILGFTAAFVVGYFAICLIVFLSMDRVSKKLNDKLTQNQNDIELEK
jgi:hypothetical protein